MQPNFTLHLGDCIESMRAMPDNSVDSIVTDPPYELGFMGKKWDSSGIANSVEMWAEALRVLKPGGHMLAFSGSRTYHRMVCAIEDAGFEIRDQIMWIYGSGFPKSLDVSKAIDKARTEDARRWQGWGTALKPAHEPIVVARKPLVGTVAANVLAHGTGALNIDGCRVPGEKPDTTRGAGGQHGRYSELGAQGRILDDGLGRWPANIIHDGSDEVLEAFPQAPGQMARVGPDHGAKNSVNVFGDFGPRDDFHPRQEADKSAARFFYCAKASRADRNAGLVDPGPQFKMGSRPCDYQAVESNARGNHHPTVKPTALMAYLVRLVTPPGGVVLDPFMGSGSTGKAAMREGFGFIGCDLSSEYLEIARVRIEHERAKVAAATPEPAPQVDLFATSPATQSV